MEPAVYRREHQRPVVDGHLAGVVAMEPAVYRREHSGVVEVLVSQRIMSQWSPPFIGGSTDDHPYPSERRITSQWSPPFIGGSTLIPAIGQMGMGQSQWSPPFIGGSTRRSRCRASGR